MYPLNLDNDIQVNTYCHSERSEDVLLSEVKNLDNTHFVLPRSFTTLRSVLDDKYCQLLYYYDYYNGASNP